MAVKKSRVFVAVGVSVSVRVAVKVGEGVTVNVGVSLGVEVLVEVTVWVFVIVGVGVACKNEMAKAPPTQIISPSPMRATIVAPVKAKAIGERDSFLVV